MPNCEKTKNPEKNISYILDTKNVLCVHSLASVFCVLFRYILLVGLQDIINPLIPGSYVSIDKPLPSRYCEFPPNYINYIVAVIN